jgi:hypothetical protein
MNNSDAEVGFEWDKCIKSKVIPDVLFLGNQHVSNDNEIYFPVPSVSLRCNAVANPGLKVSSCGDAVLLNPPSNNRNTMLRYVKNNMPLLCYAVKHLRSSSFSGLAAHC